MQVRPYHILGLLALLSGLFPALGAGPSKIYTEDEASTRSRSLLLRPARDNAIDQLIYADELLEAGRIRKADRAYRALVRRWPQEPEASVALHKHADILRRRGKLKDAFDALQQLIDQYPGQFQYEDVLQTQFDLAIETMNKRRGKFLFIPGFRAPERALDLLDQIVKNGPRWKHAPEAQYLQGSIREQIAEYDLAVLDYTETLLRYPNSQFAEPAAFGRARTLVRLSDQSPNDTDAALEARYALTHFKSAFPDSAYSAEVQAYLRQIIDKLAKGAYDIAVYYDEVAHKPQSALSAYESFARRFPSSQWTETANQRIKELQPVVENERAAP